MSARAALRSVAVRFPNSIRTNDYYRANYPSLVADMESKTLATPWVVEGGSSAARLFDEAMTPYLADPFRGTRERRVLGPGETVSALELHAARDALAAAKLAPEDVDLLIVSSFLPEHLGVGDAAFL